MWTSADQYLENEMNLERELQELKNSNNETIKRLAELLISEKNISNSLLKKYNEETANVRNLEFENDDLKYQVKKLEKKVNVLNKRIELLIK